MSFDEKLKELKLRAKEISAVEQEVHGDLNSLLVGREVRILSKIFNGQPYGRSRKPLTGRVFKIAWAIAHNGNISVGFKDVDDGIFLEEVEFV